MSDSGAAKVIQTKTEDVATEHQEESVAGSPLGHHAGVLALQNVVGNRAVQQLLASEHRLSGIIQPKLKVNQAGNRYEQEADHVAAQVLRTSAPQTPTVGDINCPVPQISTVGNDGFDRQLVDTYSEDANRLTTDLKDATGRGSPLSSDVQTYFEDRFHTHFDDVRIHTGQHATRMAKRLNAKAFTSGSDVFFGQQQYAPRTRRGSSLLAHELTHTLQQRSRIKHDSGSPYVNSVPSSTGSPFIQREEEEKESTESNLPGNQLEFKFEHKGGDRLAYSFSIFVSKPNPNPLVTKQGPAKFQLGEAKITRTKAAGKSAVWSMAMAVSKVDLTIGELMPGVTIDAGLKALEAKLENGDVDVDVFKLSVAVKGKLTKAIESTALGQEIMGTEIGQLIRDGLSVQVQGKVEVKIDPADAVRLARMMKLNRAIANNTRQAVAAKKAQERLEAESRRIRNRLKNRGGKLSKSARRRLQNRLERNSKKIGQLGKRIIDNRNATTALKKSYTKLAQGLKSKAGRLVGGVIKRAGGKLLLKLIPGINLILVAVDIFEVSRGIYALVTGKAKLGLGGGGERSDSSSNGSDAGEAVSGAQDASGEQPSHEGSSAVEGTTDAGVDLSEGGPTADAKSGSFEQELGPEVDIQEHLDTTPTESLAEEAGISSTRVPELHPAALALWQTIRSKEKTGLRFTADDLADLNQIVPQDLSREELDALLERFKSKAGKPATDVFEALGIIEEQVQRLRSPAPVTITTGPGEAPVEEADPALADTTKTETEQQADAAKRQKAIQDFLADALPRVQSGGHFGRIDPILIKDIKRGITIRGMIAMNINGKVVWGFMAIVVTEVLSANNTQVGIRGAQLPMTIFDPAGNRSGRLKRQAITTTLH